jgi:hypothetical protein
LTTGRERPQSWHWWEHGLWDCHSRAEAIAVIRERIGQRAVGELVEAAEVAPDRVVVVTRMRPDSEIGPEDLGLSPEHLETANLVTFRDGKVVAMHAYRTRADAVEAAGESEHGASEVSNLIPFVHVSDLAKAQAPIERARQAVLFYLYTNDLAALRDRLVADGVQVGEIRDGTPGPSKEMGLADPDGYCLMVAQIER